MLSIQVKTSHPPFYAAGCTRFAHMNSNRAVMELQRLRSEANDIASMGPGPQHALWKASVSIVMQQALDTSSDIQFKFGSVVYRPRYMSTAADAAASNAKFFSDRVQDAVVFIDAAIYALNLMSEEDIDSDNYDKELWSHVQHSVDDERWDQVASAAATFVEDKVRRWAGKPLNDSNGVLVGQALFAKVLSEGGPLALGNQTAETIGWRNLGMGFAAALSNVDRHIIQERSDLKQYAIGVLGLASLLLTQIRYTHPDAIVVSERNLE